MYVHVLLLFFIPPNVPVGAITVLYDYIWLHNMWTELSCTTLDLTVVVCHALFLALSTASDVRTLELPRNSQKLLYY